MVAMLAPVVLGLAAVYGITLAYLHISGRQIRLVLALGHGALVALGLAALAVNLGQGMLGPLFIASLIIFLLALLGGTLLWGFHLASRPLPNGLIIIHGSVDLLGIALLILYLLGRTR